MVTLNEIQFAFSLLSPAITLLVCGFLGIIIIYKNQHREINRVFFFWMVVSALNALLFMLSILMESPSVYWMSIVVGLLDPCIAIHFILLFSFAKRLISHRWTIIFVYLPVVIIMLASVFYIFQGINPLGIITLYTFLMLLVEFFAIGLLLITFVKKKDKSDRVQLIFIAAGIFIMTGGTIFGIAVAGLLWTFLGEIVLFAIVPLASVLLAITVLRFRLMGVEEVIKKGIVFSFVSFIIVTVFILAGEVLEFLFEDVSLFGLKIPGILTAVIIALLIIPLQGRLEKLINRIFPKKENEHIRKIRMDTYRTALKDALADDKLTKREEKLLVRVRDSLDITPEEDASIRRELSEQK